MVKTKHSLLVRFCSQKNCRERAEVVVQFPNGDMMAICDKCAGELLAIGGCHVVTSVRTALEDLTFLESFDFA